MNLSNIEKFHRKKKSIPRVIHKTIDKHEVVYGARALNKRFPPHLDRHTEDYDIFTPTPKKDANQTERALDRHFGGDFFYTKPAQHKGTYKVISKINEVGYADYTKPTAKVPYDLIGGKKYVTLKRTKATIRKTLKDPEAKYRHAKDRDALNRILIFEKHRKKGRR